VSYARTYISRAHTQCQKGNVAKSQLDSVAIESSSNNVRLDGINRHAYLFTGFQYNSRTAFEIKERIAVLGIGGKEFNKVL